MEKTDTLCESFLYPIHRERMQQDTFAIFSYPVTKIQNDTQIFTNNKTFQQIHEIFRSSLINMHSSILWKAAMRLKVLHASNFVNGIYIHITEKECVRTQGISYWRFDTDEPSVTLVPLIWHVLSITFFKYSILMTTCRLSACIYEL